jgi:Uma2 family endonuclease
MSTGTRLLTAEDLLQLDADGARHELIEGVLVTMPPTGDEHGGIVAAVTESLRRHVRTNRLGIVRAGETGLLSTDPDTVRAPDVAFISQGRVAASGPVHGYRRGAPDLAVEVVSPSDRYTDVEEKVALWFRHGARMVVVINPRRRTVAAYRSPTQVRLLASGDTLDGEEVVPGWLLPVAENFEDLPPLDDIRP